LSELDLLAVALQVTDTLKSLNIPYVIGGSMASIVHGTIRSTLDIDMVVDLKLDQIGMFIDPLKDDFYIDETAVQRAVNQRSNFNIVHLETMFKVDIFIPRDRHFDRQQLARRVSIRVDPNSDVELWVLSPEDIILAKLEWYWLGGGISDRQWLDIQGVLRSLQSDLDLSYLKKSARSLKVEDLLEQALQEAGFY
jgi:hypothetical protein